MTKIPFGKRKIRDITRLRSKEKRNAEFFVDCYGDAEVEGSLHVYLSDALEYPFEAEWRGSEETQKVTVLALQLRLGHLGGAELLRGVGHDDALRQLQAGCFGPRLEICGVIDELALILGGADDERHDAPRPQTLAARLQNGQQGGVKLGQRHVEEDEPGCTGARSPLHSRSGHREGLGCMRSIVK